MVDPELSVSYQQGRGLMNRPLRVVRLVAALVRALLLAALAAVLLVGAPLALLRLVGNPFPTVMPSWDQVSFAITNGQIDAWTWVKAFSLIAWAAWANLAAGFLAETVATIRGGASRTLRGLGATQWFAAKVIGQWALVASLVFHSTPDLATLPTLMVPAMMIFAGETSTSTVESGILEGAQPSSAGPGFQIDVGRRDTLWGLAEAHLGAGIQWEMIRDANVGRAMPDGTVLPPGFTRLEPGWTLEIPSSQKPVNPAPAPTPMATLSPEAGGYLSPAEVVVQPGDNLWTLAEGRLDALSPDAQPDPLNQEVARYVSEVVERNQDQIEDPDLIFPGQRFALPAVGQPVANPPADPVHDQPAEQPVDEPAEELVGQPAEAPSIVASLIESTGERQEVLSGSEDATSGSFGGPASVSRAPTPMGPIDVGDNGITLGAGAAVLAAGALEMVRNRRRYRLSHRRPNTVPAPPAPELDQIERTLHQQADAATAQWLHTAFASLAARPVWEGEDVAQPVLVRLTREHIDVHFSRPDLMAGPMPWVSPNGGANWYLDRSVPADELTILGVELSTPTLVTIGVDTMLNLEGAGLIAITGPGDGPEDLVRSIVHELATSRSAGTIDIRSTRPIDGTDSYGLVRVSPPSSLVAELTPWLDDTSFQLTRSLSSNAYAYRLVGDHEPIGPVIVIVDEASRAELAPLARYATKRLLPFVMIVIGSEATNDAHRIEVDRSTARLLPWDLTVEAQLLSQNGAEQLGLLLADAASTADEPLLTGIRLSASVTDLRLRATHAPAALESAADNELVGDERVVEERVVEERVVEERVELVGQSLPSPPDPNPEDRSPVREESAPTADATHTVDTTQTADSAPERAVADERVAAAEVVTAVDEVTQVETVIPPEPILIQVLGVVEAEGLTGELTSQQLSLLCYLACNGPSSRASLIDALWDGQVISHSRFPNLLAEVRARIGRHHFPEARDGRYELIAVTTDLDEFERGVKLSNRQDPSSAITTLRSILGLVRGVPLSVPSPRFWSWVGDQTHFAARVESMVADSAARLARLEQERGHLDGARWACEQGLLASPTDETLVTALTEIYMQSGKPGLARRLVDGWEDKISRMECGEPSDEPRKRLAG